MNVSSINISSIFGKIGSLGAYIFGEKKTLSSYMHRNDWKLARDVRPNTGLSVEEFSRRFDVPVEKVEAWDRAEPGIKLDTSDRLLLSMIPEFPGRYALYAQKRRALRGLETRMPSDVPKDHWKLIQGARHNLGLSAEEFSKGFDVPLSKVEEWDNATPDIRLDAKDRLLLSMIFVDPGRYALLTKPVGTAPVSKPSMPN